MSIFLTIEFYVITAVIAAAIVGFAAMPSHKGAVRTFLVGGTLRDDASPSEPGIVVVVDDHGDVAIHRFGIEGVDMSGAYSLAINISGFDVRIDERLTPGRPTGLPATAAFASADCFGAERYHFLYKADSIGRSCSFSLNVRPGNRVERTL